MDMSKACVLPDGAVLHYRVWRAARSRGRVVLLHGLASNLTRWSEFVEHTCLKDRWDLLRPDLRGHGGSFTRGRLSMEIWSDDLRALLDAEGCERAVFVGHSLGAHVALHFAARHRESVLGLALIDPAFPEALRGRMRWLRPFAPALRAAGALLGFLNRLGLRRKVLPQRDLRALDERVRADLLAHGRTEDFIRRYSSVRADLKYFPPAHYLTELAEMLRPLPSLAGLDLPALVLLSKGLTYTDPERTRRLLAGAPLVESVTVDAFHWPLTESPAAVRGEIEAWTERRFSDRAQSTTPA
ncbi:alpha/beta hydrolase [Sulfurifustis variabilis]|uniref:Alpha/beta hydrolase n=2 Tax=Sulfurifustis variabilis TaxID=1675686 RepID=A0A1B4V581_9GAMM|nr:alpha/beta hydrolase [Sulfurifustis variabilis]